MSNFYENENSNATSNIVDPKSKYKRWMKMMKEKHGDKDA